MEPNHQTILFDDDYYCDDDDDVVDDDDDIINIIMMMLMMMMIFETVVLVHISNMFTSLLSSTVLTYAAARHQLPLAALAGACGIRPGIC